MTCQRLGPAQWLLLVVLCTAWPGLAAHLASPPAKQSLTSKTNPPANISLCACNNKTKKAQSTQLLPSEGTKGTATTHKAQFTDRALISTSTLNLCECTDQEPIELSSPSQVVALQTNMEPTKTSH